MCKFCEPWNKRAKEVEVDNEECILYVPVTLAEAVTDEPKNLDSWSIRNLKECLEGGYTFIIEPGDVSYNKFKYCPYCGRKLTPEQDFKKMMAYLRR